MLTATGIEWTQATWNPTVGCTKVSPGCKNCYALPMALRLRAMRAPGYEAGFELRLRPERLQQPLNRRKPTLIFVNSMSDLFHDEVPFEFIDQVFAVMELASWHTFQVLTKRAARMAEYFSSRTPPPNVWLGVSVEDCRYGLPRIDCLRGIDAAVRFLSIEPLLEDLGDLDLRGMHWVVCGGESGPNARPMRSEWAEQVLKQCQASRVPFFFKQWGAFGPDGRRRAKRANGRLLQGRAWSQMPARLGTGVGKVDLEVFGSVAGFESPGRLRE